ncbi:MAG: hypothetical protein K6U09_07440 [Acidobacteriia bacterium]|nr:hypothetical protein [Terriglobia bacterium]
MNSIAASRPAKPVLPHAHDRAFYTGMAVAMAVTVFVGFAPTFYLRAFLPPRPTISGAVTLTPLAYVHGGLFTGWMVLFLVQTSLVAARRVDIHRRLGLLGVGMAAAMVVVGTWTAIAAAARGAAPPGVDPLVFLAIPLGDMVLFAPLVATAFWLRRNKEAHKRLMLLAFISLLAAAVARWPGVQPLGPPAFYGLSYLFIVAGVVYDLATRRRIHSVYIWGGLFLVLSVPLRLWISGTEAWRAFAEFLTR